MGILNGFAYEFRPTPELFNEVLSRKGEAKKELSPYFPDSRRFLLGFVGRAVEQKFKLRAEPLDGRPVLEHILEMSNVNVAILATGQSPRQLCRGKTNRAVHDCDSARALNIAGCGRKRPWPLTR